MTKPLPRRLIIPPGYVKSGSMVETTGRYVDGDGIRFYKGRPEVIGGHELLIDLEPRGRPRNIKAWADLTGKEYLAAATSSNLYAAIIETLEQSDITPLEWTEGPGAGKISTTASSTTVNIERAAHGASIDQEIIISGADNVGGVDVNGTWLVTALVDSDNLEITLLSPAVSTEVDGGGAAVTMKLRLAPGSDSTVALYGWGAATWNYGTWGTPRDIGGFITPPRRWALFSLGKLLMISPSGGRLYYWDPTVLPFVEAVAAYADGDGPMQMTGAFYTQERFIIAYGTDYDGTRDLMQIWSSAQSSYTDWDPSLDVGLAGGARSLVRRLQVGTAIIGGAELGNQTSLLWTDKALYSHRFTGGRFIFDTKLIATNCGLIGPQAYVIVNGAAYWVSNNGFLQLAGSLSKMPNSENIERWIFDQIADRTETKIFGFYNAEFNEIWFTFSIGDDIGNEPTLAAVYSLSMQEWWHCTIARTAATERSGSDMRPVLSASDGKIYVHETGRNADGAALPWSLRTSPVSVDADGLRSASISGVFPNAKRQVGDISMRLRTYDRMPNDDEGAEADFLEDDQTFTIGPREEVEDPRVAGRYVELTFSGNEVDGDWRMGDFILEVQAQGSRR